MYKKGKEIAYEAPEDSYKKTTQSLKMGKNTYQEWSDGWLVDLLATTSITASSRDGTLRYAFIRS